MVQTHHLNIPGTTNGTVLLKRVPFRQMVPIRRKHVPIRTDGAHQSQTCSR